MKPQKNTQNRPKSLNYLEIEALLKEMTLQDNLIQAIKLTDKNQLLLECYGGQGRQKLFININLLSPVFYLLPTSYQQAISHKKRAKITHPFVEQLKKWLVGGKIVEISQPGLQRVVMFHVKHLGEDFYFILKLWINKANLFLCNSQFEVMGSFYPQKEKRFSFPIGRKISLEARQNFSNESLFQTLEKNKIEEEALRQEEEKNRQYKVYLAKKRGLEKSLEANSNFEEVKQIATLIQSQKHLIVRGSNKAVLTNYYNNNDSLEVKLNPKLDALANAEAYFKQYHKKKQALAYAQKQLKELGEFQYQPVILQSKQEKEEKEKQVGLRFNLNGYTLLVGRNANENDELLRHHCRGLDWFFHIKGFSGGYVIVKQIDKKSLPNEVILKACALATYYSKARNQTNVMVSYTQIKYVKRLKVTRYNGLKKGAVSISQDKTVFYQAD